MQHHWYLLLLLFAYVIALETMVLTAYSVQSSGTSTHHLLVGFNDLPPLPVLFLHCLQVLHPRRERTLQGLQLLGEGETIRRLLQLTREMGT